MQCIDLQPFDDFIRQGGLVGDRHRSFYLNWVLRFLRMELPREGLSASDLLLHFSGQLERDHSLEDWQRRQAMKAADLYLNVYLPSASGGGPGEGGAERNVDAMSSSHSESQGKCGGDAASAIGMQADALCRLKKLMGLRHYSPRTLQAYSEWVQRYFRYAQARGLNWRTAETARSYLSHLATRRNVASSTRNQALSALCFLFREVLREDLPEVNAVRAKRGARLPVVLTPEETQRVLRQTDGMAGLALRLTYGAGLRVSEVVRLRVRDLDFGNETLLVRSGKGDRGRATTLPSSLTRELKDHLERVRGLHQEDLSRGFGAVRLPGAVARKYPNAPAEWVWQYVFPAGRLAIDPEGGATRRHHVSEQIIQRALRKVAANADVPKRVTVHTLRHSFAAHLLMQGVNIREVQELLGHKNVETTMIYTHVVRTMSARPKSPLDML